MHEKKNTKTIHISKYRSNVWANLSLSDKKGTIKEFVKFLDPKSCKILIHLLDDESEEIRKSLVKGIKSFPNHLQSLIECFSSDFWTIRKNVCYFLGTLSPLPLKQVVKFIHDNLDNPDEDLFWPLETLGLMGEKGSQELIKLLPLLKGKSQSYVIAALGNTGSVESFSYFLEFFKDSSWQIRKAAFRAIVRLGEPVVPKICQSISQGELVDDQIFWLLKALNELSAHVNATQIIPLLNHHEEEIRIQAIGVIGMCSKIPPKAATVLVSLLGDKSWNVRKGAAEALYLISDDAKTAIIQALKSPDENILFWSVKLIGELQYSDQVENLEKLLLEENSSIRAQAAHTLGRLQSTSSLPLLLEKLQSEKNENVKNNIVMALQMLGTGQIPAPKIPRRKK